MTQAVLFLNARPVAAALRGISLLASLPKERPDLKTTLKIASLAIGLISLATSYMPLLLASAGIDFLHHAIAFQQEGAWHHPLAALAAAAFLSCSYLQNTFLPLAQAAFTLSAAIPVWQTPQPLARIQSLKNSFSSDHQTMQRELSVDAMAELLAAHPDLASPIPEERAGTPNAQLQRTLSHVGAMVQSMPTTSSSSGSSAAWKPDLNASIPRSMSLLQGADAEAFGEENFEHVSLIASAICAEYPKLTPDELVDLAIGISSAWPVDVDLDPTIMNRILQNTRDVFSNCPEVAIQRMQRQILLQNTLLPILELQLGSSKVFKLRYGVSQAHEASFNTMAFLSAHFVLDSLTANTKELQIVVTNCLIRQMKTMTPVKAEAGSGIAGERGGEPYAFSQVARKTAAEFVALLQKSACHG